MQRIGEMIPDFFENLMSKEYIDKMVDEMCLCGVGACFIYMLRKEYWLRHGMSSNDADSLAMGELKSEYGVSRGKAEVVKRWSDQLAGCMMVISNLLRTPPCGSVHAQAPAGTSSPKSEICGNNKIIQKSAADDEKNPSVAAADDDETIAMNLISELSKDEHRYWLQTLLMKLSWGDKLQANLEWCLCYFRHHVLLQSKASTIRNISEAKRYFAAFCQNATAGSRMLHNLDQHLIRISMDNGEALSSEAKFTRYMSVNFPRISAMIEPLTYQQSHQLMAVLGKDEVVRRLERLENLRNLDHYVAALPLLQKASGKL